MIAWPRSSSPSISTCCCPRCARQGAELRGATSLTLRESGFSVRRDAHRPLLVVTRDGARRLLVRCWPDLRGLGFWAGWLLVLGAATWFAGGAVIAVPFALVGAFFALALGFSLRGVLRRFEEHAPDDVAWLAAVLDRAAQRVPPPEASDDYR